MAASCSSSEAVGRRARSASTPTRRGGASTGRRSTCVAASEHDRIVDIVTAFDPHVVVHIAVWEPFSRANPEQARR